MHRFAGLVEEFEYYPERMRCQGSNWMAGQHDLVGISERPLICGGEEGMGSEKQDWKKGDTRKLWSNPEEKLEE